MFDVCEERVSEGEGGNGRLDLNVRRSNRSVERGECMYVLGLG